LVGGLPAFVQYYGEVPGLVAGVLQVNVQIPATAVAGANTITIQIGQLLSQTGVTVWVK
jgi:uncharacterized protein (TIGR03437 family)